MCLESRLQKTVPPKERARERMQVVAVSLATFLKHSGLVFDEGESRWRTKNALATD